MSEKEVKKLEELNGFKDMRIVDNFYQTSSFFSYANNRNCNIM